MPLSQSVQEHEAFGSHKVAADGENPAAPGGGGAARPPEARPPSGPDPEVPAKATRRRHGADYKQRILREAEACKTPGEVAALLRREGLYSSHLWAWRRPLKGVTLQPGRRGPKPQPPHPLAGKVCELERENRRLRRKLGRAETIIEFQKKLSEMLGIPMREPENDEID